MNAFLLVYLFALHFIADFLLQTRDMATKKSSDINVLAAHCGIQLLVICAGLTLFTSASQAFYMAFFNALIHGVIDWHIWKGYKLSVAKRFPELNWKDPYQVSVYKYWEDSWFYSTIGLDQLLHVSTLALLARVFL